MSTGRVNLVAPETGGLANTFLEMYHIHWICDKGHNFGNDWIGSPRKCLMCDSPMFMPIIENRRK